MDFGTAGVPEVLVAGNSPLGCPVQEPLLGGPCDWALVVCGYGVCSTTGTAQRAYVCCAGEWRGLFTQCD